MSFEEGKSADYFIKKAGGVTSQARNEDIMIIKNTTHQWLLPAETKIERGDQIWYRKNQNGRLRII